MRRFWVFAVVAWYAGAAGGGETHAPDTPRIEPRQRGRVEGSVLDRTSGQPLSGARVTVEENGVFAETGKTVGLTNSQGRFRVETLLGTRHSKFDLEQALLTFPFGFLIPGGVNRVTKVLYVTQVDLRVDKPGYKPFVGPIAAVAADANRYGIELNPVLLAPEASEAISYAPVSDAELRVRRFAIVPSVVGRDRQVKLEAELVIPRHVGRLLVWCMGPEGVPDWSVVQLRPHGRLDEHTRRQRFVGELYTPRRPRERVIPLSLVAAREGALFGTRIRGATALLQSVAAPEEAPVADLIARGFELEQQQEPAAALTCYEEAAQVADFVDHQLLHLKQAPYGRAWLDQRRGSLLLRLQRPLEAVHVLERLASTQRESPEQFYADFGTALLESGQIDRALNLLLPFTKDRRRSRGLPPDYHLALARCYLEKGELARADEFYMKAARDALWETEFVQEFNLSRVRAALKADPMNPDLQLAHGRSLADRGRYEEALVVYRSLLERDPSQTWIYLDMAQALTRLQRHEQARAMLQRALELQPTNLEAHEALAEIHLRLANVEAAFEHGKLLAESPARQRDFDTRHRWALLLLARGDHTAALRELEHAIYLSRGRSEVRAAGLPTPYGVIPFGAKRSLSTGFNRVEAERDFILLQELRDLEKNPQSALAQLNLGVALVELGFAAAGRERLLQAQQGGLRLPELHYALGRAALLMNDRTVARRELNAALKLEPLFDRAYLTLAELASLEGDSDQAQQLLLQHAALKKTH